MVFWVVTHCVVWYMDTKPQTIHQKLDFKTNKSA